MRNNLVVGGWAVLDLPPISFMKLELHCGRFAPLPNLEILSEFSKLDSLNQRGAQSSTLCLKHYSRLYLFKYHLLK